MSSPQHIDLFLDLLSNQPKDDKTRREFARLLRERCEEGLEAAVERIWDLPSMVVRPEGEYLALLIEARELYVKGHFYSCVAMCGIVGERLTKDAMRASVLVQKDRSPQAPLATAFDQLERVEVSALVRFLGEVGILSQEAAQAARDLGELRNRYAHARGRQPQPDALDAIKLLHVIVEDTVSVFKHFEIKDGVFVPKRRS